MRIRSARLIAWSIAAAGFAVAVVMIQLTPAAYLARARAEINRLEVSPEGLATFARVQFTLGERTMPQEAVARLRSSGSLVRALRHLGLPHDQQAVESASHAVMARLAPGTTVIEVIARADQPDKARALVDAVLAVQDDVRHEDRVRLTDQVLATLDGAAAKLREETQAITEKLSKFDVYRPLDYAGYSVKLEATLVDITSQRAKMSEALPRLEAMDAASDDAFLQHLTDRRLGKTEDDVFNANQGYVALRASLDEKRAELAKYQTSMGPNSSQLQQVQSELRVLQASLRQYLKGEILQLRSRIAALDKSVEEITQRLRARDDGLMALQKVRLSPEYDALTLRGEVLRAQLKQVEARRVELQTYRQLYEPALSVIAPALASEAPEHQYRAARLVFAAFGALFVGISLQYILSHPRTA
jgi:uncharacterized protein involved in exopolysaccharide biosynthesis